MKRIMIAAFFGILLCSCGTGSYTISSGKADIAEISFTASESCPVEIDIDGKIYKVNTVKTKAYKKDRKIKKTVLNTISVSPGKHELRIIKDGQEVLNTTIFISTDEHRIISL